MRTDYSWICTANGRQFWPLDPEPGDVFIDDIAHALAMKCRYTGHTREFYSVAQHSYLASYIVPEVDCLWALLHDATEAYLPDVSRPVKTDTRFAPVFCPMEDNLHQCIAKRFGLPWPMPESIHVADRILLATERRDLMVPVPDKPWKVIEGVETLADKIHPWTWQQARTGFMSRFLDLTL